jgi:hypothetical protein
MRYVKHKLTPAQQSAIMCSGELDRDKVGAYYESDLPGLDALRGALAPDLSALVITSVAQADEIARCLTEMANAEDVYVGLGDPGARGARTALTNLAAAMHRVAL